MNSFLSAFSPKGRCSRRAYWGRMLLITLGFTLLLNIFLLCLLALRLDGADLGAYQRCLFLSLSFTHLFSLPAGLLAALPGWAYIGLGDPPHFPEPTHLQALLLQGGMLLSGLGLLVLTLHSFMLALRRLRDAGMRPGLLAILGLFPIAGCILLTGLLTFPTETEQNETPGCGTSHPGLDRRSYALRSLPSALLFTLSFGMSLLLYGDIILLYRAWTEILLLLALVLFSIPAMASHPLATLAVLLAFIFNPQLAEMGLPKLATGNGYTDTALAAGLLLTLLLSSGHLTSLAARRLHDSGAEPMHLLSSFAAFLLLLMASALLTEGNIRLLWPFLFVLWLAMQSYRLSRPSQAPTS